MTATRFYSELGINVETYDVRCSVHLPDQLQRDIEFFESHAGQVGGPILELGCGTGRVSWELAKAGFEVVGIDRSDPMICAAEAKRWKHEESIEQRVMFIHEDMVDFDFHLNFRLIVAPYRSFQALTTPEEQRRALERIKAHLDRRGWLVLDLFDPNLEMLVREALSHRPHRQTLHSPISGNLIEVEVIERHSDPFRQLLTETWRFTELDGTREVLRQEDEILTLRWTYRHEMRYLLELSGFEILAEYSDFRFSPPCCGAEQVWICGHARH